jgi:hypothetical protein
MKILFLLPVIFFGSFLNGIRHRSTKSYDPVTKICIESVNNKVRIGPLTGNPNLSFGVKNVMEEAAQDKGYDIVVKDSAQLLVTVDIIFFDKQQTNSNIGIFHKDENDVVISMKGTVRNQKGKVLKEVTVTDKSSEVSTSTAIVSESGQFSSAMERNAVKKTCVMLSQKLFYGL